MQREEPDNTWCPDIGVGQVYFVGQERGGGGGRCGGGCCSRRRLSGCKVNPDDLREVYCTVLYCTVRTNISY